MNISHFFLCVIRIDFTRHCEGIWKPWYQHYIMKRSLSWKSLSAQHQQWHRHFFFFFFFFFWKIEHLYPIHLNIFFIYIYIFFPVIQHQYHFDEIIHFSTISHSFIQGINSVLFNDWTFGSTCLRAFQEN